MEGNEQCKRAKDGASGRRKGKEREREREEGWRKSRGILKRGGMTRREGPALVGGVSCGNQCR